MTPERVLVTGGAGFIGSHTVDLLLSRGIEVIVLDNLSSGRLTNLPLQQHGVTFVEGDVLEFPLIEDLLVNCDAVLHLAAIASVPYSIANPIYSFQVNTQGFLHVLEAVRRAAKPVRLVYASSAAVYGDAADLPCDDAKPLSALPLSPYALQKIHDEDYAALYDRLYGIRSLGMRYFNVYGHRQDPQSPYSGVISRFLEAYRQDGELVVFGDGQQSRDFIYVEDVAAANVRALCSDYAGVLNIATGQPETLSQMIEYMEKAGEKPARRQHQPARQGDIKASYAATGLAREQLDFQSTVPLAEGLRRMLSGG